MLTVKGKDDKIINKMMLEMMSSYYNKIINKGEIFMNELMVFNNVEFGEIRSMQIDGKIYFVGKDIASALGYKDPSSAVSKHCKHIKKVQ